MNKSNTLNTPLITSLLLCLSLGILLATLFRGQDFNLLSLSSLFSGQQDPYQSIVIWQWRASRLFAAVIIGAALGLSGAIFQALVRNPLGSPDITGFNVGAFTGVLITTACFGNKYWFTVMGSLAGGLFSAILVYLFAYRGGHSGFRLIIVGIAISATLTAFNQWLSISVSIETAMSAALWLAGSLNGMTWGHIVPASLLLLFLFTCALSLNKSMRILEMGDDTAAALGVNVNYSRLMLMLIAVALTAVSTAITGPISFIALAAPQIAQRLHKANKQSLLGASAMGALLLSSADLLAQQGWQGATLPVGLVTVSLGGIYLVYLIIREGR